MEEERDVAFLLLMVGLKSSMQKTWVFNRSLIQDKKTLETFCDIVKETYFSIFFCLSQQSCIFL